MLHRSSTFIFGSALLFVLAACSSDSGSDPDPDTGADASEDAAGDTGTDAIDDIVEDTSDVSNDATDTADDTTDVSDADDVSDASDAMDTSDTSDAMDTSDADDTSDAGDTTDTVDPPLEITITVRAQDGSTLEGAPVIFVREDDTELVETTTDASGIAIHTPPEGSSWSIAVVAEDWLYTFAAVAPGATFAAGPEPYDSTELGTISLTMPTPVTDATGYFFTTQCDAVFSSTQLMLNSQVRGQCAAADGMPDAVVGALQGETLVAFDTYPDLMVTPDMSLDFPITSWTTDTFRVVDVNVVGAPDTGFEGEMIFRGYWEAEESWLEMQWNDEEAALPGATGTLPVSAPDIFTDLAVEFLTWGDTYEQELYQVAPADGMTVDYSDLLNAPGEATLSNGNATISWTLDEPRADAVRIRVSWQDTGAASSTRWVHVQPVTSPSTFDASVFPASFTSELPSDMTDYLSTTPVVLEAASAETFSEYLGLLGTGSTLAPSADETGVYLRISAYFDEDEE